MSDQPQNQDGAPAFIPALTVPPMYRVNLARPLKFTRNSSGLIHAAQMCAAMDNGQDVIVIALAVESSMALVIQHHFFPAGEARNEFREWILDTNWCGFENKRKVFQSIVRKAGILDKAKFGEMDSLLSRVITYRNAFAHGSVEQIDDQFFLCYYKNGRQEVELTEIYWKQVESDCEKALKLVDDIFELLKPTQLQYISQMVPGQKGTEQGFRFVPFPAGIVQPKP